MLGILLDQLLKKNRFRDAIVRNSFFVFNGLIGGLLINDLIRILYGDFDGKQKIEYGLSGFVGISPFIIPQFTLFDNKSNNIAMASGMALGTYMANRTEHKEPIV